MPGNDSIGDFTQEFDLFRCMAYELTILRYTYNVIEANLVQFMIDYPEDSCVGIKQALDPLYRVLNRLVSRNFGNESIVMDQTPVAQSVNQSVNQSFGVPPRHSTPIRNQTQNQSQMRNLQTPPQQSNIRVPLVTLTPASANAYNSQQERLQANPSYEMSADPNLNSMNELQNTGTTSNRTPFVMQSHLDQALNVPVYPNQTMAAHRRQLTFNTNLPGQVIINRTLPTQPTHPDRTMPVYSNNPNLTMPVDVDLGVTLPGLQATFNRTRTTQGVLNRTLPGPNPSNIGVTQPVTSQPSYTLLRPGAVKPRWKRNSRQ